MKLTILLYSSLLVVLAVTNLFVASAASNKVLDAEGQELRRDTNYYIFPAIRGAGGGLNLYRGRSKQCPMDVAQETFELQQGIPVTFTPANPKEQTIRTSSDLNIKFSGASKCPQSTVWRLDNGGASSGPIFISTGGVLGNPGPSTVSNWFRIEKVPDRYDNLYKLVYCPSVCNKCRRPVCGDVGIAYETTIFRRLAVNTGAPYHFILVKARF